MTIDRERLAVALERLAARTVELAAEMLELARDLRGDRGQSIAGAKQYEGPPSDLALAMGGTLAELGHPTPPRLGHTAQGSTSKRANVRLAASRYLR